MEPVIIPNKSWIQQMFCKHTYKLFEKPRDKKKNPMGFVSLNPPLPEWYCTKCGHHKKM